MFERILWPLGYRPRSSPGRLTVATLRPTTTDDDIPAFLGRGQHPFAADPPPAQPCRIVLRQIDDGAFSLSGSS